MPRHNFDPDTKNKSFSNPTHTKTMSIPISTLKSSQFRPPTQPNQYNHYPKIKSSSTPHAEIMSSSTTHVKTKSISMLTLKPSDFRPPYKNSFNFNHHTKPSQSIPTLKTTHFRPARKTKSISIPSLKLSQFRSTL